MNTDHPYTHTHTTHAHVSQEYRFVITDEVIPHTFMRVSIGWYPAVFRGVIVN